MTGWYLGCFKEKPLVRAFNISAGNYFTSDSSGQECTSACAYLNQSYAATEGDLCFCTSGSYDKHGRASSESLCNIPVCSDTLSCNDTTHIRVYSTQDAIGGLNIEAPQTGWLLQEMNFTTSLRKGIETIALAILSDFKSLEKSTKGYMRKSAVSFGKSEKIYMFVWVRANLQKLAYHI